MEKFGVKADLEEFLAKRNRIFMNLMEIKTKTMPGLFELMDRVRGKYRLALCSSGVREYIDLILRKLGLNNGLFEVIISGDMVRKGKPDPEPYIITTKRLHLPPRMCVVLEDSQKGVASAKAAGCRCIGVRNPVHPIHKQDLSGADLVVHRLDEIKIEDINNLGE
jgi:HAD superfamily hydrolase (TIGR01509 family)